jgi:hypothetical protein
MPTVWRSFGYFCDAGEHCLALKISRIKPPKEFLIFEEFDHRIFPNLWIVVIAIQPSLESLLDIWEDITTLPGIAVKANRALDLGQPSAHLAVECRDGPSITRHLARR